MIELLSAKLSEQCIKELVMFAIQHLALDCFDVLLSKISGSQQDFITFEHLEQAVKYDNVEMFQRLDITAGVDFSTLFMIAVDSSSYKMIDYLMEKHSTDINYNCVNADGNSALTVLLTRNLEKYTDNLKHNRYQYQPTYQCHGDRDVPLLSSC